MRLFIPELMKNDVYEFTPDMLNSHGIRGVIFDIDNTLAPYEKARPDEKLIKYFETLKAAGIGITLVSNNNKQRVDTFNEKLGFFAVPDAHKPSAKGIRRCIGSLGTSAGETVFIGDQLFTDCTAAHRAGIRCFIVRPIAKKETLFFKFKRFMEKPFIRAYKRREKAKD